MSAYHNYFRLVLIAIIGLFHCSGIAERFNDSNNRAPANEDTLDERSLRTLNVQTTGRLAWQRKIATEGAIEILKARRPNEHDIEAHFNAVFALWFLKPREAIPVLSDNLLFEPVGYQPAVSVIGPTYAYYPAASALIAIGPPAVPAMLRVIRDPKTRKLQRRLACWVLLNIEANADPSPENALEDEFAKEGVIRRLLRPDPEFPDQGWDHLYEAVQFIRGFANTEGRWQDIPTLPDTWALPHGKVGKPFRFQVSAEAPQNHPDAKLQFATELDAAGTDLTKELGLVLSPTGALAGFPKKSGNYTFKMSVKATFPDATFGNTILANTYMTRFYFLQVDSVK